MAWYHLFLFLLLLVILKEGTFIAMAWHCDKNQLCLLRVLYCYYFGGVIECNSVKFKMRNFSS